MGAVQLAITLLRLGDLTRYISHSVIVGFTLGAGTLLVLDQVKNLLGLQAPGGVHDHFVPRFLRTLTEGGAIDPATMAIGLGSIAAVLGLRWLKRRLGLELVPELVVVVVAAALLVGILGLDRNGCASPCSACPRPSPSRRARSRSQTSTMLAIRRAYELIPAPCRVCPRGAGPDRPLHYVI